MPQKLRITPDQPAFSIAQAKANFSSLISAVEQGHRPVTISRRGVPVALVVPFPTSARPKLSGSMAGTGIEIGDIVSPYLDEWTVSVAEENDEDD